MPHDTKNLSTIGDLILLILADRSTVLSATTAATMSNNNGIKTNSQRAALGMNNIANQMSIDRGISICDGIGNDNDIDIGYHADGWPVKFLIKMLLGMSLFVLCDCVTLLWVCSARVNVRNICATLFSICQSFE